MILCDRLGYKLELQQAPNPSFNVFLRSLPTWEISIFNICNIDVEHAWQVFDLLFHYLTVNYSLSRVYLTVDYTHLLAGYWVIILLATLFSVSFFQNGFSRKFVWIQLFTSLFERSVQTKYLHQRVFEWDQLGFVRPSIDNEDFINSLWCCK